MKKEKWVVTFVCIMGIFIASLPLLGSVVYNANGAAQDTFFHTQRIWSIKNAIEAGQFPVRIYSEIYNGYGYGSSLLYPELFLYFPAILCMIGVPLAISYNFFLIIVNVVTMAISYYSYKYITKSSFVGLIASLMYTLSTYRLLDLYTRGSMGEFLALIFCPLVLCGLEQIKRGEYHKWWILSVAFSGMLQSHILSFVLMAILATCFAIVHLKRFLTKGSISAVIKAIILAVLMNLWFIVPFLQSAGIRTEGVENSGMKLIAFLENSGFWQTSASVAQLFDVLNLTAGGTEVWGSSTSSMPKTPGIVLILGAILFLFVLVLYPERIKTEKKKVVGYFLAGIFSTVMLTNIFPWKIISKIEFLKNFFEKFQFIWRFNILAILFLSISAAYAFYYFFIYEATDKYKVLVMIAVFVCVMPLTFMNHFIKQADMYDNEAVISMGFMDRLYVTPAFNTQGTGEIQTNLETMKYGEILRGKAEMHVQFEYEAGEKTEDAKYIEIPLTYYPQYKAYINGEPVDTVCSIWGIIKIYLPKNCTSGTLDITFEKNGAMKIADIISVFTIIIFMMTIAMQRVKNRKFGWGKMNEC